MKFYTILISALVLGFTPVLSQDSLWFTRTGRVYFISHTDIIDIDANNYQVGSFLNIKTGEVAFSLLMKTFEFTLPLAEEHFNENYVESEKYPKATFKGRINSFNPSLLVKDADYPVEAQGDLSIHGVTAKVQEKGILRKSEESIRLNARFEIRLDTYKIKVPNIVADRVAQVIPIDVDIIYKPYGKGAGK